MRKHTIPSRIVMVGALLMVIGFATTYITLGQEAETDPATEENALALTPTVMAGDAEQSSANQNQGQRGGRRQHEGRGRGQQNQASQPQTNQPDPGVSQSPPADNNGGLPGNGSGWDGRRQVPGQQNGGWANSDNNRGNRGAGVPQAPGQVPANNDPAVVQPFSNAAVPAADTAASIVPTPTQVIVEAGTVAQPVNGGNAAAQPDPNGVVPIVVTAAPVVEAGADPQTADDADAAAQPGVNVIVPIIVTAAPIVEIGTDPQAAGDENATLTPPEVNAIVPTIITVESLDATPMVETPVVTEMAPEAVEPFAASLVLGQIESRVQASVTLTLPTGETVSQPADEQGAFQFEVMESGEYQLLASAPGALSRQMVFNLDAGQQVELPATSLSLGDVNQDGSIDLNDIVLVAANYDGPAHVVEADLNGDSWIDISDLTLIGAKFGLSGPLPWDAP